MCSWIKPRRMLNVNEAGTQTSEATTRSTVQQFYLHYGSKSLLLLQLLVTKSYIYLRSIVRVLKEADFSFVLKTKY